MSFPFEKQPATSPQNTSQPSQSLTDWERVNAMDDEDIIFDEDNPEIQPGELQCAAVRLSGITPTPEQIECAKRQILEYINRSKQK
jgi:hypothetical protein